MTITIVLYVLFAVLAYFVYKTISDEYKKRYVFFAVVSCLLLGPLFSGIIFLMYLFIRILPSLLTVVLFLIFVSLFLCFKVVTGYYPIPYPVKKIVYLIYEDIVGLDTFVLDEAFNLSEKGYSVKADITSPYAIRHLVVLELCEKLPVEYKSEAQINITIHRNDVIIFNTKIENMVGIFLYKNGHPTALSGFHVAEIPFPLGNKSYKSTTITIEVFQPDEIITNSVKLILCPDTRI